MKAYRVDVLCFIDKKNIKDGLIIISENKIDYVGEYSDEILKEKGILELTNLSGTIMPGFINCHTHLELSYLHNKISPKKGFVDWLSELDKVKIEFDNEKKIMETYIRDMKKFGVIGVGDITNSNITYDILMKNEFFGYVFHEYYDRMGLKKINLDYSKGNNDLKKSLSPHAFYSTSSNCIKKIIEINNSNHMKTSIHYKEHIDELEFYKNSGGRIEKYFSDRWNLLINKDSILSPFNPDFNKILNSDIILVHNLECNVKELKEKSNLGVKLVFCPRSNIFITGCMPNFEELFSNNIKFGLGTDSLASNHDLDIRKEVKLIRMVCSEVVSDEEILMTITHNAAKILDINNYGLIYGGDVRFLIHTKKRISSKRDLMQELDNITFSRFSDLFR